MEEKKSRRPGTQTTVRRIPSEAVKTTKNNRAAQAGKKGSSERDPRRDWPSSQKTASCPKTKQTGIAAQKQAEELTRASRKAGKELSRAIRFSLPEEMRNTFRTDDTKAVQSDRSGTGAEETQLPEKEMSGEESSSPEADASSGKSAKAQNEAAGEKKTEKEKPEHVKAIPAKGSGLLRGITRKHKGTSAGKRGNRTRKTSGSVGAWTKNLVKAGKVLAKPTADSGIERRQKRVYKQRLVILLILMVFAVFLGSCVYHVFHFQRNTVVNGVDVSGLSVSDAADKMERQSKYYSLLITADGSVEEELIDSVLHVKVTNTDGLKSVLRRQNPFTWITGGFRKKQYTAKIQATFDADRLKADIAALSILQTDNMVKPVDASLKETGDGHYEIRKETIGSTFDVEKAAALITEAVGNYQRTVSIAKAQEHPDVYSTSENLNGRMKQWNGYLKSAGISYNFPAKTVTLGTKDIASLLSDDGETVTVSYAKVADLMANWRETYDTYNNSFQFKTQSGETIKTWYEGDYGFELNEEGTAKDLIACIKAGDTGNHDPEWYHKGNSMENMGLGDTYVEISLDDQHLWVHKDGEIVVDTDVVTGNPNPDDKGRNRETYKGCYAIKGKYQKVTLGTLDVQGYASPVNYWVPFNGGEGLHDAPWRDEFGGSIYLNNGSHGCVNCPEDIMGKIYANVEKGEAVIIY